MRWVGAGFLALARGQENPADPAGHDDLVGNIAGLNLAALDLDPNASSVFALGKLHEIFSASS